MILMYLWYISALLRASIILQYSTISSAFLKSVNTQLCVWNSLCVVFVRFCIRILIACRCSIVRKVCLKSICSVVKYNSNLCLFVRLLPNNLYICEIRLIDLCFSRLAGCPSLCIKITITCPEHFSISSIFGFLLKTFHRSYLVLKSNSFRTLEIFLWSLVLFFF